jgi:2-polyprenyl-6-methoxyphenol hydroxylase-like FAD-dependent oxidoreductase
MKIACVGGGPAGLYFSILMKLADPANEVTVFERNPAGVTYGWGVVFWDDLLDDLYRSDPVSAREIAASSVCWNGQEVRVGAGQPVFLGGSGFSVGRKRLLDILARRAIDLGVEVRFESPVQQPSDIGEADLVIACDGANSQVRQRYAPELQTEVDVGRNKYIWLGTHRVFDAFTFAFEKTPAGWIWFHAYYFDRETSTCIIECSPETWEGLAFDTLGADESIRRLEEIFGAYLDGHPLINQLRGQDRIPWLNFRRISNQAWVRGNIVLMGDAAHTTHFAIGSGTRLAIQDAIGLAGKLTQHQDLGAALKAYEEDRRHDLLALQSSARNSTHWFEEVQSYIDQDAVEFGFSLWKRRGRSPAWRYRLHLATQISALRRLRRWFTAARRSVRARRRGRLAEKSSSRPQPS